MQYDLRELAWAAGLFEGEGCISTANKIGALKRGKLQMAMSDEDSVRRFHAAVGGLGNVRFQDRKRADRKNMWFWETSRFEHIQAVLCLLWFGLGTRRKARAAEVFQILDVDQCNRVVARYNNRTQYVV